MLTHDEFGWVLTHDDLGLPLRRAMSVYKSNEGVVGVCEKLVSCAHPMND